MFVFSWFEYQNHHCDMLYIQTHQPTKSSYVRQDSRRVEQGGGRRIPLQSHDRESIDHWCVLVTPSILVPSLLTAIRGIRIKHVSLTISFSWNGWINMRTVKIWILTNSITFSCPSSSSIKWWAWHIFLFSPHSPRGIAVKGMLIGCLCSARARDWLGSTGGCIAIETEIMMPSVLYQSVRVCAPLCSDTDETAPH